MSSSPADPRPLLSTENSRRLKQALQLTTELREAPTSDADTKLSELRTLLNGCRTGIREQNPNHRRQRIEALDQARNYLHFLPDMQHEQAPGRLRSVSRRLTRALRD